MSNRLSVLKTYKIYINGQFPRTESGRYYVPTNPKGQWLANVCLSSKKDVKEAVVAARAATAAWHERPAFNRGQILYRIAEMLEGRKAQFIEELMQQGSKKPAAEKEVLTAIDRLIYYSGWCDKYQQIFSSVNPVASAHFNFSILEPMGVVAAVAPQNNALIGLVSIIAPIIAGGNTCIILASEKMPLSAVTFAEVLQSSDVPAGVVNILTGNTNELAPCFADHMDINAVYYGETDAVTVKLITTAAASNLKRVVTLDNIVNNNWTAQSAQSPYYITAFQEVKTIWHPIEKIGGAKAGY